MTDCDMHLVLVTQCGLMWHQQKIQDGKKPGRCRVCQMCDLLVSELWLKKRNLKDCMHICCISVYGTC